MKSFDIGIRCNLLLTKEFKTLSDQFIGINDGKIAEISAFVEGAFSSKKQIDASHHLVMPSLINGHTHLPMTLFRGLADDSPFNDWLYKYILPLENKLVNEEFVRAGTELALLESIRFGVTTFFDMYYFEHIIADAIDKSGARGVCAEAVIDFPVPDNPIPGGGKEYEILAGMVERYKGHERIHTAIGPHAPYSCSDETLLRALKFSEKHDLPIHIHVSETKNEIRESLEKFKKSPVKRLYDLGLMTKRTIFAHCVHLTDEDIELIAKTGTSVIYNPESNLKLGNGVAPIKKLLHAGVAVGIGTDGAASNNDLSILREIDTGTKAQKLANEDSTAMVAKEAVELATSLGAKALGLENTIGSLSVGMAADIILVDLNFPHMRPVHNILSQLAYSATGLEVDTVICNGKILLENGKHTTLDAAAIYDKADFYKEKIDAFLLGSV